MVVVLLNTIILKQTQKPCIEPDAPESNIAGISGYKESSTYIDKVYIDEP